MALSLNYHVVQYVDDPFLAEGRNVAVVCFYAGRGHFRALGVDAYGLTPSLFKSLSSKAYDSYWAYREWAEWFRYISYMREANLFNDAVARLEASNFGLVSTHEGVIELANDFLDVSEAMDYLFKRLVRAPKVSPALVFEDRLEEVFNQAEIAYVGDFWDEPVQVEMESENGQEIVTLEFSHLLAGDRPAGFNILVLQGQTQKSLARQTERISTTFRNAIITGFLQPDRCILLCGRISQKNHTVTDQFSGIATVVDIFDESTPELIRRLA